MFLMIFLVAVLSIPMLYIKKNMNKKYIDNNYDYLKDESLDRLFFKILNEFNKFAKTKDRSKF